MLFPTFNVAPIVVAAANIPFEPNGATFDCTLADAVTKYVPPAGLFVSVNNEPGLSPGDGNVAVIAVDPERKYRPGVDIENASVRYAEPDVSNLNGENPECAAEFTISSPVPRVCSIPLLSSIFTCTILLNSLSHIYVTKMFLIDNNDI